MEILVRYKNGSLYNKSKQEFITLEDAWVMASYKVTDSATKKDITAEVSFLAAADFVRRKGLWKKARVVIE